MILSKKQQNLLNDIKAPDIPEIYVLGSTQSGKTYDIALGTILYAQELYNYNKNETYYGAIIGWSVETLKGNILDVMESHLQKFGMKRAYKGKGDYEIKWGGNEERYIKFWNIKIYFFGFNNKLSFNKILGKPLIFVWCDESARIYTRPQLRETFDELPGRQMSYADHPYLKTIHSFNVEGNENHPYKIEYIDGKPNAKHYTFFPYDNPKIKTPAAIKKVLELFPKDSPLQKQKVFNIWCIASGLVFTKINIKDKLENYAFREIGIGVDYGSTNPTTFVPIALAYNKEKKRWELVRLEIYYHNPKQDGDNPTTEFYSNQLRLFLLYLKQRYPQIPITTIVIDSEATHYHNRLYRDNIPHELAKKGAGSVDEGVQHLQSMFEKEIYWVYEQNSIKYMQPNGQPVFSGKDDGLLELRSYQYDSLKCETTGSNIYKKEFDHHIDATRYLLKSFRDTGRCPEV